MIAPFGAIDASRSRPLSVDPASTWRTGADVWVATEVPLVAPWAGELTVAPSGLVLTGEDATLRITADEGMPGSEPTSVSLVTVSKVLRNHPDVGALTRERVLKKVRELNYRPNVAARMLVTGRTFNIGLIVPDLVHSFFAEIVKGATPVLRAADYNLVISSSEEDPELERHEIEQLVTRGVDVLVVASAQNKPDVFANLQTPVLLLDREIPGFSANFVGGFISQATSN